ncbi:hypothetical protein Pla163_30420 [Planctomycetes bacterium Pla163]|uniref:DUF1552 domain-containing protein n=1 Tax=Rohdeia mirabilis TaxID=2528008 RepID=A0A518D340_9BACT|nr:hypothetical protein Pla163_30420 [Planctomycetes bacterium Pla163]
MTTEKKSTRGWRLGRRSFLRGVGVACLLPYLEAMGGGRKAAAPPKRACFVYFPNGCSLPDVNDAQYKHWRWFPEGQGADFRFTKVLEPLAPFQRDLAIHGGLSHPKSRELLGHLAGDSWLTAGDLRGGTYTNSISLDQVIARQFKAHTRYPSFVLSSDGGVGYKSRISTLSFDGEGRPIPAQHDQRRIFERYFAPDGGGTTDERRRAIQRGQKIVDLVLEESRDLTRRLGARDQQKMDEYLTSLNDVEEQVRRNEAWLDTPLPPFSAEHLQFDADPRIDPGAYVRTMYDLMVLGFQTDVTRVMTYMLAREDGLGIGENWPRLAIGADRGHHTISHDTHAGHWDQWGPYDRWYAEQFAYFLGRMKAASDEHGSLLDSTAILYGSACSTTHNARNYPMLLAGGRDLGIQLGRYTHHSATAVLQAQNDAITGAQVADAKRHLAEDDLPCSNLYLSLLRALGVEAESFADSTGELEGVRV